MTELTAGMEAPDFTLESDAGTPVSLSALRGNGVVLYFYPELPDNRSRTRVIKVKDRMFC
ncbi:redoxin domain-containing protein [Sutterella wadsworthensis]|uniref:redoxin domain-containing protein n=1 Tax=Sutterella wadsworthensis TaxID=40545 RepID=UPI001F0DCF16|nr:redoxin domain-containing protein [Sutterella wadsworthensis]